MRLSLHRVCVVLALFASLGFLFSRHVAFLAWLGFGETSGGLRRSVLAWVHHGNRIARVVQFIGRRYGFLRCSQPSLSQAGVLGYGCNLTGHSSRAREVPFPGRVAV